MLFKFADVEKPTLLTLIELGDIRIIEESACEYQNIGIILLTDTHGDRVAEIEHDNTTDTARMREIYKKWLKQGASWATLCDCLNRCHLEALANKIRSHFGIVSPAPLPGTYILEPHLQPGCKSGCCTETSRIHFTIYKRVFLLSLKKL